MDSISQTPKDTKLSTPISAHQGEMPKDEGNTQPLPWGDSQTFQKQQQDIDEIIQALSIIETRFHELYQRQMFLKERGVAGEDVAEAQENVAAELNDVELQLRGRLIMAEQLYDIDQRLMDELNGEFLTSKEWETLSDLRAKAGQIVLQYQAGSAMEEAESKVRRSQLLRHRDSLAHDSRELSWLRNQTRSIQFMDEISKHSSDIKEQRRPERHGIQLAKIRKDLDDIVARVYDFEDWVKVHAADFSDVDKAILIECQTTIIGMKAIGVDYFPDAKVSPELAGERIREWKACRADD